MGKYICNNCGLSLETEETVAGTEISCPVCDTSLLVPPMGSDSESPSPGMTDQPFFNGLSQSAEIDEGAEESVVPQLMSDQAEPSVHSEEISICGYQLVRKIGEGGMGSVFEAVQKSLGRTVAIKVLPERLASDRQFVKRFEREAGALSQLRHPNIVGIIDRGSVNGIYYFVMEYVTDSDGSITTLNDLIFQHKLDGNSILKFTREIADALAYAHSKGIVHRDVKPSNILIDEHSAARVVDFGIAQIMDDEQNRQNPLTMTGGAIGTPQYMSPEHRKDMSKADARSDIYSLGIMAYEMLTGGFPEGAWELPSELGCAPGWDSIIETAIRKRPERRFQTMTEFIAALDAIETVTSSPKTATASTCNTVEKRSLAPATLTSILGKCSACGLENSGDNRFCSECGAPLYEACPACQEEFRVGLRFCGKCGIDISKQKKTSALKKAISKALGEAYSCNDNIVTATGILLDAVKLEDALVTLSGDSQTIDAHAALNNLWNEKTLAAEFFSSSGVKHIEFLSRISKELPDRQDIQAKIQELLSDRNNLLEELRRLFKDGYFESVLQTASKSRWNEYAEIFSIVFSTQERLAHAGKLIDTQIPALINDKRNFELNKVLTELERLGAAIDGLSELRNKTNLTLDQAKQLYESAVNLDSANKLPEAAQTLETLFALCSDYPEASNLLDKINCQKAEYLEIAEEARKLISIKKYKKATDLLMPVVSTFNSDELKALYSVAAKGAKSVFRKKMCIGTAIVLLAAIATTFIIVSAINRHMNYKIFNSYCEKAHSAFLGKEYENAVAFYNDALNVPGYDNDVSVKNSLQEIRLALERKPKFDNLMAVGNQYLERKEWASAEKAFRGALKIPGYENDGKAKKCLKECEDYFAEKNDAFNNAVYIGTKALSEKKYEKALESFDEALKIPGYETREVVIRQKEQAKLNLDRKNQYENLIFEAKEFLNKKDLASAENSLKAARSIQGYENDMAAYSLLSSLNIQKRQCQTNWNMTKLKIKSLLHEAKRNYINIARRIESADSAMSLLQKLKESLDMSCLPDLTKKEIADLESEIKSIKYTLDALNNDVKAKETAEASNKAQKEIDRAAKTKEINSEIFNLKQELVGAKIRRSTIQSRIKNTQNMLFPEEAMKKIANDTQKIDSTISEIESKIRQKEREIERSSRNW